MSDKVSIYLFEKHIADVYEVDDRIYLRQYDNGAHRASPLSIAKDMSDMETTSLLYLDRVAGFISDSLPGSFGEEILDNFFMQNNNGNRPTIIDKLLFIGNRGLGALEFRPAHQLSNETQQILSLKDIYEEVKKLKRGDDFKSIHDAFLVSAHSFVGGARSKAVASINLKSNEVYFGDRTKEPPQGFTPVIIKYDDTQNGDENKSTYSKLEYVYYKLAKMAGIDMSESFLVESNNKYHFVTKRFDRVANKKFHVHSLAGLLQIDYNIPRTLGYEDLFRVAVQLNATASLEQLFLQMLFNYMFVNQDDHPRNFSFMCDETFEWKATPAYDLTFAKGVKQTKEHQMTLGGKALSQISLQDIVKVATEFSISLEFVSDVIETMRELRENKLTALMNQYRVSKVKQEQLLKELTTRDFQGELNG